MAIVQVSVETVNKIKRYRCLSTDWFGNYPTIADCDAGSVMEIVDPTSGIMIASMEFDGLSWKYVTALDDQEELFDFEQASKNMQYFDMDFDFNRYKTFDMELISDLAQRISVEVEGTITLAGDITATVTTDYLELPKVYTIPVLETTTMDEIAEAIATAINEDVGDPELETVGVGDFYIASFLPADETDPATVFVTKKVIDGTPDETLNLAIANDDATGLTEVAEATVVSDGNSASLKYFRFANVPKDAIADVMLMATAGGTLRFPTGTLWSSEYDGSILADYIYQFKFITRDGGTHWLASLVGKWLNS